ncbi:MAG: helicase C-terminal domain-containing protein [Candidatus Heimdallarchaeaceae archaeon]
MPLKAHETAVLKPENVARLIFPYANIKQTQEKIISAIIRSEKPIMISTRTGVGKTVALLTGLLAVKKPEDKIIIFMRTKAQINVYLREMTKINQRIIRHWNVLEQHFEHFPFAFPLVGKNELCAKADDRYPASLYTHLCSLLKCNLKTKTEKLSHEAILEEFKKIYRNANDLVSYADFYGAFDQSTYCPFYFANYVLQKAEMVFATYPYLENEFLHNKLLVTLDTPPVNLLIGIDEAHNLYQPYTSTFSLNAAYQAFREFNHPVLLRLRSMFGEEKVSHLDFDDTELVEFQTALFTELAKALKRGEKTKFYSFLAYNFITAANHKDVIVTKDSLKLMSDTPAKVLNRVQGTKRLVLMSGSFEPLRSFQRLFKLYKAKLLRLFPQNRRAHMYFVLSNPAYSGQWENRTEGYYGLVGKAIGQLVKAIEGHTLVFVPSYSYASRLYEASNGVFDILEEPDIEVSTIQAIVSNATKNKTILAVAGGKISEGVEFSLNGRSLLKGLIVTALPYAPPSIENQLYYEKLKSEFGHPLASEFAITIPMLQRLSQCFGRAIRSSEDQAFHILLDARGTKYAMHFGFQRYATLEKLCKHIERLGNRFDNNVKGKK